MLSVNRTAHHTGQSNPSIVNSTRGASSAGWRSESRYAKVPAIPANAITPTMVKRTHSGIFLAAGVRDVRTALCWASDV